MAFPTILLLIYSAVHLSQNTLCLVHLLGVILFFSSLRNSHSPWEIRHEEHLFCDVCNSSPLRLLKNSGCSLVYCFHYRPLCTFGQELCISFAYNYAKVFKCTKFAWFHCWACDTQGHVLSNFSFEASSLHWRFADESLRAGPCGS